MGLALLVVLCGILTLALQKWVGGLTIYLESLETSRAVLHTAIVENTLPEGVDRWRALGANATNVRVLVVFVAEGIHRVTGTAIHGVYRSIDTICLFSIFLLVFVYLRHWLEPVYCLAGLLYVGFATVLTYFFHYFHPWDRPGLLSWLILLLLIRRARTWLVGLFLPVAVAIKGDVLVTALVYGLATYSSGARARWASATVAIALVATVSFVGLGVLFPGGPLPETLTARVIRATTRNLDRLIEMHLTYPPLLVFALPVVLSLPRLLTRERFVWSTAMCGYLLFVPHALLTNAHEVRAQMPILILLLPAALLTLREQLQVEPIEAGGPSPPELTRPAGATPREPRPPA